MRKILTWAFLLALIFIHTVDMELTYYYIGNDADAESFPPMRWAIRNFGIHYGILISRAIMYPYFWLALYYHRKDGWFYFLIIAAILYWTSMLGWFFQLGLMKWPFPSSLLCY